MHPRHARLVEIDGRHVRLRAVEGGLTASDIRLLAQAMAARTARRTD